MHCIVTPETQHSDNHRTGLAAHGVMGQNAPGCGNKRLRLFMGSAFMAAQTRRPP